MRHTLGKKQALRDFATEHFFRRSLGGSINISDQLAGEFLRVPCELRVSLEGDSE